MELVHQQWQYATGTPDGEAILKQIEEAGRVCYKSEDRITPDSARKFVKKALDLGHHSIIEHPVVSVHAIMDRGVSHELVRHRIASYSQESTRYCNYKGGVTYIYPVDFVLDETDKSLLHLIESHYQKCLAAGRSPQQARYFLPNGLKTEVVFTFNMREWRHFFTLRCSNKAHPQMRELARSIHQSFKMDIPVLFDDITY